MTKTQSKHCSCCKEIKPLVEFYRNKSTKDRLQSYCKVCSKLYYTQNRESIREHNKNYDKEHSEERKAYSRDYGKEHKDERKSYRMVYHEEHKEECTVRAATHHQRNKKRNNAYAVNYRKTHKAENNKRARERRRRDGAFRACGNLYNRVYVLLKGKSKSAGTMKLIGCTFKQLKVHLESQFTKGMNWDNYGKWHVDHMQPINSFTDLTDPVQQRECFKYTNLQPLWAADNFKKGSKYAAA